MRTHEVTGANVVTSAITAGGITWLSAGVVVVLAFSSVGVVDIIGPKINYINFFDSIMNYKKRAGYPFNL